MTTQTVFLIAVGSQALGGSERIVAYAVAEAALGSQREGGAKSRGDSLAPLEIVSVGFHWQKVSHL